MKIHVICCIIQGTNVKPQYRNYFLMTRYCIASLLKLGLDSQNITCIAENKKHCKILKAEFNINTIHGPPIPKNISHLVSKSRGRKLFMYKPICLSKCMPEPVDDDTIMVMTDVDALFIKNPVENEEKTDVWSQHAFKYLRPSRVNKLKSCHLNPSVDNMEELTGYFGSKSQTYLFMKYKQKSLPQYRITSNLVFIKPNIYNKLINTYMKMCEDIIINVPHYCKGDQEILSSAMNILGLSYSVSQEDYSIQYNGKLKQKMIKDANKLGIFLK